MQEVSCYKHSFFFELCIYFKTVHFPFSSPFLWWYVKVVLFPRHLPTSSGPDTRSHPCWSQPSPWWGSEDESDWVSIPKSLSLPLCCYLRCGIYGCPRRQWAVVSAFSPQWFPGWFLAEQASKQQPLHAGSSSSTSAEVPSSFPLCSIQKPSMKQHHSLTNLQPSEEQDRENERKSSSDNEIFVAT